ncbi:MAG: hypothetical protein IH875_05890 [Candidatus Dadabacteria bacterium]|nr:hypothetical protein [Candidatus Dadabacteria bacterium]
MKIKRDVKTKPVLCLSAGLPAFFSWIKRSKKQI